MFQSKLIGGKSALLAGLALFMVLGAHLPVASASQSGCVTCHLDKEMIKQNIAAQKGQKSAMQSGAG